MIFRQGVGRFDQFHAADLVAPILVEPDANQNALVGEHENGIAVHGQMNARRGAALPVGNFVSLPDLIPGGCVEANQFSGSSCGEDQILVQQRSRSAAQNSFCWRCRLGPKR